MKRIFLAIIMGLGLTACMPPPKLTVEDINYKVSFIEERISFDQVCSGTGQIQYDCQQRENDLNKKGDKYVKRLNELNSDAVFTYDKQQHIIYKERKETAQDKNSAFSILNVKAVYE